MVIYLLISTFEFASFTSLNVLDKIIQIGCFSHFYIKRVYEINPSCDLLAGAELNLAFESVA